MVSITVGLVGGLVGSIAMAAAWRVGGDDPWPSAVVWAMYVGDGHPEHYEPQGLLVHLGYGALAGGLFVVGGGGGGALGDAVLGAVAWATVLALVAVVVWLHVLVGADLDAGSLARLAGLHILYGVVLGLVASGLSGL